MASQTRIPAKLNTCTALKRTQNSFVSYIESGIGFGFETKFFGAFDSNLVHLLVKQTFQRHKRLRSFDLIKAPRSCHLYPHISDLTSFSSVLYNRLKLQQ